MQYETIILELMTRIKKLEDEVATLKEIVNRPQQPQPPVSPAAPTMAQEPTPPNLSGTYIKMTDEMINTCYIYGKMAHETGSQDLWTYADMAARETGMNRNSAFMYICAVKSMFEGTVFKRAINSRAMDTYFSNIHRELGAPGLKKAISAVEKHMEYRRSLNHPIDSIVNICNRYRRILF